VADLARFNGRAAASSEAICNIEFNYVNKVKYYRAEELYRDIL